MGTVNVLAGTTTLTGANSYDGATNVNAGTLRAGALNTFSPNSPVTVASGGTLDLNGFDQTIAGLTNAGLVNMGTGTAPGTVLTTTSYTGTGGTIAMNTFLGGDNSPSDRLVINGGTASGTSGLRITNAGGSGDLTLGNGIPVVVATNGGTTAPGAFGLSGPVVAGPYEYFLFRGGVTPGNENDWFLRNVAGPIPPEPPGPTRPDPIPPGPTPPVPPPGPAGSCADPVLPAGGGGLCRVAGARPLHRPGDPRHLPRAPGRAEPADQERRPSRAPGAAPSARGPSSAAAGRWRRSSTAISSASRPAWISAPPRSGRAIATISVSSSAMPRPMATCAASRSASAGWPAARCRWMQPASASTGPMSAPAAGISTAVLMHSWLDGEPRSNRGVGPRPGGPATTASLEGGYPIWLTDRISLEPQAQLIWQHVVLRSDAGSLLLGHVRCRRRLDRADRRATAGHLPGRHDHVAAVSEGRICGTASMPPTGRSSATWSCRPRSGRPRSRSGRAWWQRCRRMSACSRSPTTPRTSMARTAKPSRAISVFGSHGSKPSHDPWQGSKDRCIAVHDGVSRPWECHILAHSGTRSNVSSSREHRTFLSGGRPVVPLAVCGTSYWLAVIVGDVRPPSEAQAEPSSPSRLI